MTDLDEAQLRWQQWIDDVCAELGVASDQVDVTLIHALSKVVAHGLERPLAPVSTFILGLAAGQRLGEGESIDQEKLAEQIGRFVPSQVS